MATVVFPEISNNGFTQLDGAITDSATTINVDSSTAIGLSDSTTDAYVTIVDPTTFGKDPTVDPETFEIVQITAISTNQWTVTRGVDGTSGIAFSDNAYVFQRVNAAVIQRLMDALTDGTDDLNINALIAAGDIDQDTATGNIRHTINTDNGGGTDRAELYFTSGSETGFIDLDENASRFRIATNTVGAKVQFSTNTNTTALTIDSSQNATFLSDVDIAGGLDVGGAIGGVAQSATGDGTTTIDWTLGNHFHFKFGAANDTFTFTAPANPGILTLRLIQDSVGTRSATWPATVKWSGASAPTLTTTANTGTDLIAFYYDGTNYIPISTTLDSR